MTSNVPKPAARQPGWQVEPHLYCTYLLTNLGILVTALWGSKMLRLREDAEKCTQLFSNTCPGYNPSCGDTQVLLRELS